MPRTSLTTLRSERSRLVQRVRRGCRQRPRGRRRQRRTERTPLCGWGSEPRQDGRLTNSLTRPHPLGIERKTVCAAQRDVWASRIAASTIAPPSELRRAERLAEPDEGDGARRHRLEHRDDPDAGRRDVAERRGDEQERDHRPGDDDVEQQQPDRQREALEMAEQRDAVVEPSRREAPDRLHERPEERREEEAVRGQRGGIAPLDGVLGHQHVDRVRDGGATSAAVTPSPSSVSPLQTSTTTREPDDREHERDPDPAPDRLLEDRPRPERDQDRRDVLDQERDPDRQPPDRDEVEPLHERDARDPEDDQVRHLAAGQPQALAARQREHEREAEERAGRARPASARATRSRTAARPSRPSRSARRAARPR